MNKNNANAPEALFFDDFEQISEKVRGKVALIDGVLHISEDLKGINQASLNRTMPNSPCAVREVKTRSSKWPLT